MTILSLCHSSTMTKKAEDERQRNLITATLRSDGSFPAELLEKLAEVPQRNDASSAAPMAAVPKHRKAKSTSPSEQAPRKRVRDGLPQVRWASHFALWSLSSISSRQSCRRAQPDHSSPRSLRRSCALNTMSVSQYSHQGHLLRLPKLL